MTPHDALRQYFGFAQFRPGQREALEHLLAGRDLLTVMPTGSGKSLIYQLAALLLPGVTLVISPLVALMKDQVDGLARRGIAATLINSSLDVVEQNRRIAALARGDFKIVLVAPERLRSAAFSAALARVPLSLLVVDEAHCLSQWGHDFRPDYLYIADARRAFNPPLTLALTATATTRVQDDIIHLLGLPRAERLVTGFNRPNLFFEVRAAPDAPTKLRHIRELLMEERGAGILYAGTRRDAEEVAEFVREMVGIDARHYHAGLAVETRAQVQNAFLAGDVPVIVATNAFGMGIDRPDVRFVLHHTMPGTLEAYYQEAGRAGRDGLPARAILLYSNKDTALHESFIENDSPAGHDLRAAHDFLRRVPSTTFEALERAAGMPETKARVAVEQLEAAGVIRRVPTAGLGALRVEALPLPEATLRRITWQVEARRKHRRALLQRMVTYAETNACRRRTILDYFGDHATADASLCCDNDLARATVTAEPSETTASDETARVVLETIAKLKWGLGKEKIAQLLKGSRAKDIARFTQTPHYGALAGLRLKDIESLLAQLLCEGYLKQVGGELPVLKLTARSEEALKTRTAFGIRAPEVDLEKAQPQRAEREAGGTLALTEQLLARGLLPEQIAEQRALSIGTIYSHFAQLIAAGRMDINHVVPAETQQQIRAAIEQVGSAEYLAPIKARVPDTIGYEVIRCVANAWRCERGELVVPGKTASPTALASLFHQARAAGRPHAPTPTHSSNADPITEFLARAHPRPLQGPWLAGWALDFHSRFSGDVQERSAIGALVFRFKYNDERGLARELAQHWANLLAGHAQLPKPDAVIPVPPSLSREFDPVGALAEALGHLLGVPVLKNTLVKTRATKPQKEITSLAQKQANVARAFVLAQQDAVRRKHLILVDDLYDSGATLEEAARVLARGGAASLIVLTLTKTIHASS